MTTQELFANLSEVLAQDEEMLSSSERELLANIFERAKRLQEHGNDDILQAVADAVGDTIAERAKEKLGSQISRKILRNPPMQVSRARNHGIAGMGTPSVPSPSPDKTAPRPPSPGPPSPQVSSLEARAMAHHMGTPSVPSPSPDTRAPRPPSPGPPSPQISRREAETLAHHMGTPSVPPPSPSPTAPRPPSPGPPSPQIEGHDQFAAPRPPSPGPPSPGTPISPLPPSTGPHSAWFDEASRASVAISRMPRVLPASCVLLDEFLMPSEVEELLRYALEREQQFVVSEVISPGVRAGLVDYEHRRSRVLYDMGAPGSMLVKRVEECLPRILPRLACGRFPIARVEAQMTASNHGDFFRWHCDDGQEEVARREITFVYFFHREPKEFQGGELRIYQSVRTAGGYIPAGAPQVIVPQQNQLVIFPSALAHEITPVECSSGQFAGSRFTLNGWFHR